MSSSFSNGDNHPSHVIHPERLSPEELRAQFIDLQAEHHRLTDRLERLSSDYHHLEEQLTRQLRTVKKLELQLAQALRKAESASNMQAEFLDTISHELLTPLNGILGMARLLDDHPLDKDVRESINTINSCGEDLEQILTSLLKYIHLSKGEIEFHSSQFDIQRCIHDLVNEYATLAYEKRLELTYLPQNGMYSYVETDQEYVKQLLHILISNAIKFTHRGHILVTSKIELSKNNLDIEDPSYELIVSVSDTGVGVSMEEREQMFRPFAQLDSSRTRSYSGIGMGLTLGREIVSQLDGAILIDSIPQQGSTFTIVLPTGSAPARHPPTVNPYLNAFRLSLTVVHPPNRELILRYGSAFGLQVSEWPALSAAGAPDADVWLIEYPADPERQEETTRTVSRVTEKTLVTIALIPPGFQLPPHQKAFFDLAVQKPISPERLYDALSFAGSIVETAPSKQVIPQSPSPIDDTDAAPIILVEGNPINQKIILHLLGMLGRQVEVLNTLDTLLERTNEYHEDYILINPDMDPSQDMSMIRTLADTLTPRNVRFISITSRKSTYSKSRLESVGFERHIVLPARLDDIARVLEVDVNF